MIKLGKVSFLPIGLAATAAALSGAAAAFSELEPKSTTVASCRAAEGYSASFDGRRTFLLHPDQLRIIKARRPDDPAIDAAYRQMIARADAARVREPGSVMDKRTIPPSGDRHDYLSIAPYWWPDPANPKGPYVRRDGEVNPARDGNGYDRTAIGRMSGDVQALGLAYYYTDDERYAAAAARAIRAWFLDPATAMNPNANFAQAVRGREDGRAEGVLDTNAFQPVIETIGLIAPAKALTPSEIHALEAWFGRYVDWMQSSRNGRDEQAAKNNHGIWYDDQITHYALFARRLDVARKTVEAFPKRRIVAQFTPDGRLPAELARTRSFHYSIYALSPAYDVADLAACVGKDLWNWRDDKGRGLRAATDFLARYRGQMAAWPYKEIKPEPGELDRLLARAAWAWPGSYGTTPEGYPIALTVRSQTAVTL
ncbi:alginate lyase family protein [Sphingomonadaceae bacterium OTU29MARTA1]|nr:alginate lyase family protein [Sphingomonadaceae bacterium OTU29MARTA1]